MVTDPIAALLTDIRNSNLVYKDDVVTSYSKMRWSIVNILKDEGFLSECELIQEKEKKYKTMRLGLKYAPKRKRVISGLKRLSKPGRRVYSSVKDLRGFRRGFGVTILSTQKGVLTDKQALKEKVGGEVLCTVW